MVARTVMSPFLLVDTQSGAPLDHPLASISLELIKHVYTVTLTAPK